jgi:MoaA/NifB/PqqE/SkfB family radical SAM enzyme
MRRYHEVLKLGKQPNTLAFRISLDYPDPGKHDEGRGQGNFMMALRTAGALYRDGFRISIASRLHTKDDRNAMHLAYLPYLKQVGLPCDTRIISFPDLLRPFSQADVPQITENCMTTYKNEESRARFMCSYVKMVTKVNGKMGVYPCTLVDDDDDYNLGTDLRAAMDVRIMLKHHRCFSCFASGTSCSEG